MRVTLSLICFVTLGYALSADAQVRATPLPVCYGDGKTAPQVVGRVVRSDNGKPVAGAKVSVFDGRPGGGDEDCAPVAITDSDGQYSLWGLQSGSYTGSVFADGYVTGNYNCTPGLKLVCGDRERRIDASSQVRMDYTLMPEATIHGVVKTPDGKPVRAGVKVNAVPTMYLTPKPGLAYSNWGEAITDAQGTFALRKLPPGEYVVRVHQDIGGVFDEPGPWYQEAWFGNTAGPSGAKRILLKEGEQRGPVTIVTHAEQRHRVTLQVSGPEGSPPPREYMIGTRDCTMSFRKQPDGSYVMRNVASGHYPLQIEGVGVPGKPGIIGPYELEIDVPDADVTLPIHVGDK